MCVSIFVIEDPSKSLKKYDCLVWSTFIQALLPRRLHGARIPKNRAFVNGGTGYVSYPNVEATARFF